MINERNFILAEITELEALLAATPEEDVIDRMSLESRLAAAREALEVLPPEVVPAKKAVLTFRGKPVDGTHGISASFGSKAVGAFSDAFAAIAASLSDGLQAMGPIPDKARNQLLITGTAVGSFGFEFELPSTESNGQGTIFPLPDKAQEAMGKLTSLLQLAAEGSDDEVAAVVEEVAPRAVKKVHEFLDWLAQQHSWCRLTSSGKTFGFVDYRQLKAASERLKDDNIREENVEVVGSFAGVLPDSRSFEFRRQDDGSVIRGKIDKGILNPAVLNQQLNQMSTVSFKVTRFGQGAARYTLLSLDSVRALHD